jgi:hypothetical protein
MKPVRMENEQNSMLRIMLIFKTLKSLLKALLCSKDRPASINLECPVFNALLRDI